MLDLFHEIGQTMRSNRLRTILTGISVSWGVFMLILLLGLAKGLVSAFEANQTSESMGKINVWNGITSKPWRGYATGRYIRVRNSDLRPVVEGSHGLIASGSAIARNDTARIIGPADFVSGGFTAAYPSAIELKNVEFIAGRFINSHDMEQRRRSIVLSERKARLLFGSGTEALGKTVSTMGLAWTVVGVYTHNWISATYVPYSTYISLTGGDDFVYQLEVQLADDVATEAQADAAEQSLRRTMAARHNFDPDDNNAMWLWNSFKTYLSNKEMNRYLVLAVWVLGLLTLLTGIVGVSNIMFVSVRERIHEIGIRRAIGARPRSILVQVLCESVAITALFGYIGVFMGMVILQILDAAIDDKSIINNPTVDIRLALQVTLALIVAGAVAGLFPALKAIKVKPVEALRDE